MEEGWSQLNNINTLTKSYASVKILHKKKQQCFDPFKSYRWKYRSHCFRASVMERIRIIIFTDYVFDINIVILHIH